MGAESEYKATYREFLTFELSRCVIYPLLHAINMCTCAALAPLRLMYYSSLILVHYNVPIGTVDTSSSTGLLSIPFGRSDKSTGPSIKLRLFTWAGYLPSECSTEATRPPKSVVEQ